MLQNVSRSALLTLPSLILLAIIHLILQKHSSEIQVDQTKLLVLDIGTLVSAAAVIFVSVFQKQGMSGVGKLVHHAGLAANLALAVFAFVVIVQNCCICRQQGF